jgi:hypothetical protein
MRHILMLLYTVICSLLDANSDCQHQTLKMTALFRRTLLEGGGDLKLIRLPTLLEWKLLQCNQARPPLAHPTVQHS